MSSMVPWHTCTYVRIRVRTTVYAIPGTRVLQINITLSQKQLEIQALRYHGTYTCTYHGTRIHVYKYNIISKTTWTRVQYVYVPCTNGTRVPYHGMLSGWRHCLFWALFFALAGPAIYWLAGYCHRQLLPVVVTSQRLLAMAIASEYRW